MGHHAEVSSDGGRANPVPVNGPHPAPPDARCVARARAFLAVALIPLAPAGRLASGARAAALGRLAAHPACGTLPPAALDELADLTLRNIALAGPTAVLAAALPHLPRPEAETALALAARAARASGAIAPSAAALLDAVAARLGLAPEVLAMILDVTAMLDRP